VKARLLAAAAVLVSAYIHLTMWFDGVRDQHVIGPSFMVNAVAGIVIAVLLVLWWQWVPLFLAVGFGVSTLAAFVISSTVGLFGIHAHWSGGNVWAAAVSEVVAILAGVLAAWREGYLSQGQLQHGVAVRRSNLH